MAKGKTYWRVRCCQTAESERIENILTHALLFGKKYVSTSYENIYNPHKLPTIKAPMGRLQNFGGTTAPLSTLVAPSLGRRCWCSWTYYGVIRQKSFRQRKSLTGFSEILAMSLIISEIPALKGLSGCC